MSEPVSLSKALYLLNMNQHKRGVKPETVERLKQQLRDACAAHLGIDPSSVKAARQLLTNPISLRLAEGQYPSRRDDESMTGYRHDRHLLIWVRHYEALLRELIGDECRT